MSSFAGQSMFFKIEPALTSQNGVCLASRGMFSGARHARLRGNEEPARVAYNTRPFGFNTQPYSPARIMRDSAPSQTVKRNLPATYSGCGRFA
jgi:hypothetical protein